MSDEIPRLVFGEQAQKAVSVRTRGSMRHIGMLLLCIVGSWAVIFLIGALLWGIAT